MNTRSRRPIDEVLARVSIPIAYGFDRVFIEYFSQLENHLEFAKSYLEKHKSEWLEIANRAVEDAKEEQCHDEDDYNEDFILATEIIPNLQWNAQFLVAYSTFEKVINQFCLIVERRSEFDLSSTDLSGNGIERSKNYLSKVAGVKSPFQSNEWCQSKNFARIRNAIAHGNSRISLSEKEADTFSKISGLTLIRFGDTDKYEVTIDDRFLKIAIDCFKFVSISVANYPLYAPNGS